MMPGPPNAFIPPFRELYVRTAEDQQYRLR